MREAVFTPPPTLAKFMLSDARVRVVTGPVGSGKTTACIYEILRRAGQQQPWQGVRRVRVAIIRQTLSQIKNTVLRDMREVFEPVVDYRVSESAVYIHAGDLRLEILLLPLDTPEDQKRLLSTQLTFAFINEALEIDPELVTAILGRCGRYPSKAMGGPTWYGVFADSNPGVIGSPWYELLVNKLPEGWAYFEQPTPVDVDGNPLPGAENILNLPENYYRNLLQGHGIGATLSPWAERYVLGHWASSLDGQGVFSRSFNPGFHLSQSPLVPQRGRAVVVGLDCARNGAAVAVQIDTFGRLLVLDEAYALNTGLELFLKDKVRPLLASERYAGCPVVVVADPSGVARSQIGEESSFDCIRKMGFACYPASSNRIEPRLRAVESWLLQQRNGKAALLIDSQRCPTLVQAMRGSYRYRVKKDGELEDTPEKKHPESDLCDAMQYACMGTSTGAYGRILRSFAPAPAPVPPLAASSWT
jgi:hypothetical protein